MVSNSSVNDDSGCQHDDGVSTKSLPSKGQVILKSQALFFSATNLKDGATSRAYL